MIMCGQADISVLANIAATFSFEWDNLIEVVTEGRISVSWVVFGLAAQFVVFCCLMAQWYVSSRRRRIALPVSLVYVGLIAIVMLLVYASIRHDVVFVVGQLLNIVIALRLIELLNRSTGKPIGGDDEHSFPTVEPDTAERFQPSDSDEPD